MFVQFCGEKTKEAQLRRHAADPLFSPSCQFGNLGSRLSTLVLRIVTFSLLPFPPGVRTNNRPSGWEPGKAMCKLQRKGQKGAATERFYSTSVHLRVFACLRMCFTLTCRRQQARCREVCGNCIWSAAAVPVLGNAPPLLREDTGVTLAEGLPCSGCKVTGKETKCA